MKHFTLKKHLAALLLLLCGTVAMAHNFEVDGIYYNITDADACIVEVTYEGDNYDYSAEYVGSVTIPESVVYDGVTYSVTTIGNNAFEGCNGLTSVTIPNSVTTIGHDAFWACHYLTSITIPNSVTEIGFQAFGLCTGLTSITIPNSVTTIGHDAFWGCDGLTSVTIPNSVTIIGDGAFTNCSSLTSIIIPNSVTTIGERAFDGCTGLTSITIPGSVTTIGGYAFRGCSGLTSITIPSSVTTIGDEAFYDCSSLESIVVESGNTIYDSREGCNAIIETATNTLITGCKNTVIPSSVTTIGDYAFYGCSGLTSITIPNSVTTIGIFAFNGCSDLTSITIPNSVTTIEVWAFSSCIGLTSVTIPNGVTTIGEGAFEYCSGLTSVTIPNSVTTIESRAFSDCSGLTSITIPNSVTTIGQAAFRGTGWWNNQSDGLIYKDGWLLGYKSDKPSGDIVIADGTKRIANLSFGDCYDLTSVTIPNSVTTIGYSAFSDCTGLTSITIGNSVTTIGIFAFYGCIGLESITIPNSVTTIGNDAFRGCTGLTSITIPNSVSEIGNDAFRGCTGLTSITIGNSVTTIGEYAFEGCIGLTSITIPNSVTTIENAAFEHCTGLTSITIGNSVTEIGIFAFYGCTGLTSITIPNSVTTIGDLAFNGCSGLTSVTMLATTPPSLGHQSEINSEVVLYVPVGTKELYENARYYSSYFSRIEEYFIYNDGTEYSYDNIKEHTRIIYNREFPDTAWQAWYLPFDVPYSTVADELEVAYLNDVHQFDDDKDGNIDRTELEVILLTEGTIEANYPYVVRAKNAGNKIFNLPDVAIVPFEENYIDCSSVNVKYTFTGTHTAVNVFDAYSDGCYNIVNGEIVAPTEPEGQKQEDQVTTTETEVTDLAQLENSKLYTIASARCFLLYSSKSSLSDKLCTSSGSAVGNVTRDINDLNQLFQIVKEGDAYYLYSVGAGKYINKDGNYTNSKSDALTLEHVGGTYPWKLCLGGNGMNSQEYGQFDNGIVVNGWTDTDAGNCYKIVEIEKQVIKGENPTAIEAGRWYLQMEARNSMTKLPSRIAIRVSGKEIGTTGIDEVESEGSFNGLPNTYYDLQGRIVEQPTRGIYIYNGKKLFVK